MKKIVLTVAAVVLALAMTGCSFTVTKTETSTDANGKTTTHTSTTTNQNGKITTSETVEVIEATEAQPEKIVATIAFDNRTGLTLSGLYLSSANDDNWGANILEGSDPLEDGYTITITDGLTYAPNNPVCDLKLEDPDGRSVDFRGLDISLAADSHNITIVMTYDAETDTYHARVE